MSDLAISKHQAQMLSDELCSICTEWAKGGLYLARKLDTCLSQGVPAALGMDTAAWLDRYVGHSLSDVRRKLQISRGLAGLPDKELFCLPEANAHTLLKLPQGERTKRVWLDKAKELPVKTFREAVDKATGRDKETPEDWATTSQRLPRTLFDLWEQAKARVAEKLGVDLETLAGQVAVYEAITAVLMTERLEVGDAEERNEAK